MSKRIVLADKITSYRMADDGPPEYYLEVREDKLWNVVKAHLFEKYVEDLFWWPALKIDNVISHFKKPNFYDIPLDIKLELKTYDLREQNKDTKLLGRVSIQKDTLKPITPIKPGRSRR